MNKSAKLMTNVKTYIIIIFIFLIMVTLIQLAGLELGTNENAILDNDSIEYIAQVNNIDLSEFDVDRQDIEDPTLISANSSQGNPKDYALDFQFAKEKGLGIEVVTKNIYNLPGVILLDLLRLNKNDWSWIVSLFFWLWVLLIIIALVYFARNQNDK